MKVALNGKPQRVIAVLCGTTQVRALYQGTDKLWPSDGTYAMGLRIETPQPGLLDYLYWLHTMSAVNGADIGTSSCYLRFQVNDTYYYIGASPDESPALQIKGEVVQLNSGIRTLLMDYIGSTLRFEAVIPSRTGTNYKSPRENVGFNHVLLEPWLPGTYLTYTHYKGKKKVCSHANGTLTGIQTGKVYIDAPWHNHQGHKRGSNTHVCKEVQGLVPDYDAEPLRLNMAVGGASAISSCYLTYPAFSRVFNLTVKSVY